MHTVQAHTGVLVLGRPPLIPRTGNEKDWRDSKVVGGGAH